MDQANPDHCLNPNPSHNPALSMAQANPMQLLLRRRPPAALLIGAIGAAGALAVAAVAVACVKTRA